MENIQTIQLSKEKGHKDKQWSTKHYAKPFLQYGNLFP
jgi:hypothetical protein